MRKKLVSSPVMPLTGALRQKTLLSGSLQQAATADCPFISNMAMLLTTLAWYGDRPRQDLGQGSLLCSQAESCADKSLIATLQQDLSHARHETVAGQKCTTICIQCLLYARTSLAEPTS